tara:strand:+ start:180 stop:830 length:651 start_codon:yes stop_codon:yes gene_type:complete
MDNAIIIPLSGALGAASKTVGNWGISEFTALATGVKTASATTAALDSTSDGDGAGAKFVFKTDASKVLTVDTTGFVAGAGYKTGDIITVSLPTGATTAFVQSSGAAISVTLSVTEAILAGGEDNAIITCPSGGYLVCVEPGTSGDSFSATLVRQIESGHERLWKISHTGVGTANYRDVALAVNVALMQTLQRPNSNPILDLPSKVNGVLVTSVALS